MKDAFKDYPVIVVGPWCCRFQHREPRAALTSRTSASLATRCPRGDTAIRSFCITAGNRSGIGRDGAPVLAIRTG